MFLNNILQGLAVVGEFFFWKYWGKNKSNTKKTFFAPKAPKQT